MPSAHQPPSRRAVLGAAATGAGALLALGAAPHAYASTAPARPPAHSPGRRLPFLMDMVQANPGEPMTESRYNDPRTLASYGYDGQVINEFRPPHTGVTFDTVDDRIFPAGSEARAWVEENARGIDEHIRRAHAAGIDSYFFTDIIVLPKRLVELYGDEVLDDQGRISLHRPRTLEIHRLMLREVFARFPGIDGLVIRTGETYLQNVPYHTGNNPITEGKDSHHLLIGLLRDEVCVRAGKRLFYRTWSTGGDPLTNDPAFYRTVTDAIEPHRNLLFSVKHTAVDFWRTVAFNPTLGIGNHRQIAEVECAREYEAKGACPDYIGDGVINGFEEYAGLPGPQGLADLAGNPLFAGVWTWSRGGGWRGPYITNELWCDLNMWVVARWTRDTGLGEAGAFRAYAHRAGLSGSAVDSFHRLALLSAAGTLRGHYSALTQVKRLTWTRDQYLGGSDKDLTDDYRAIVAAGSVERILAEKAQAARIWQEISALSGRLPLRDRADRAFLRVSSRYGLHLYSVIHHGWQVMLRAYAGERSHLMAAHLRAYDSAWASWQRLADREPSCATLYQPLGFGQKDANGVYGADPDHGMGPSVDACRKLLAS
ncbi:hypothetical protein OG760_07960 [Streptomyces sp. NBC_00963]|uniref:hypothetical protein n=1 Tax=unclassified Streptomyces TaxID=2593676 RepID=UPI002259C948|nr:hypothetical protein [Streptomyces sp. NBC_01306]MCX4727144.1 hypothetical protein [Streptomyces sp. NBC_01306]WSX41645.1 hypothetical protein OG760_07960 [Streptomyces sp. NBC_00963]